MMTDNRTVLVNALRSAYRSSQADDGGLVEDGLRLILAFMRISDPVARRSIVDIVERVADSTEAQAVDND